MPDDKPRNQHPRVSNGNGNGEDVGCGTVAIATTSLLIAYILGMVSVYVCFCMQ